VGNPDGTLSAAEGEARKIAQLPGFDSGEPLIRGTATLENIRSRLPDAGLVHFATHARASDSYPNFSYLQLANSDRLYSIDLGGLPFYGKRVFLSACDTSLGQNLAGDDIYGVADAFLADGASSVISTLWRIESESSALFAERYYALLSQFPSEAVSLSAVAREFIEGKWYIEQGGRIVTLTDPIYWAGFNHLRPGLMAR
jgi:CHAT domain-containing protein